MRVALVVRVVSGVVVLSLVGLLVALALRSTPPPRAPSATVKPVVEAPPPSPPVQAKPEVLCSGAPGDAPGDPVDRGGPAARTTQIVFDEDRVDAAFGGPSLSERVVEGIPRQASDIRDAILSRSAALAACWRAAQDPPDAFLVSLNVGPFGEVSAADANGDPTRHDLARDLRTPVERCLAEALRGARVATWTTRTTLASTWLKFVADAAGAAAIVPPRVDVPRSQQRACMRGVPRLDRLPVPAMSIAISVGQHGRGDLRAAPPSLLPNDKDEIRRLLRWQQGPLARCYREGLRRKPDLGGRVVLQASWDRGGRPLEARVVSSLVKDAAVGECLAHVLGATWLEPRDHGSRVVATYPLLLVHDAGDPIDEPAPAPPLPLAATGPAGCAQRVIELQRALQHAPWIDARAMQAATALTQALAAVDGDARYASCREPADRVLDRFPTDTHARASRLGREALYQLAVARYRWLLSVKDLPGNPRRAYFLGEALYRLGRFAEAIPAYQQALEHPDPAWQEAARSGLANAAARPHAKVRVDDPPYDALY